MSENLRSGDVICLYVEKQNGYLFSALNGSANNEIVLLPNLSREKPNVPDISAISFKVCIVNRYKINKKLRKLEEKVLIEPNNIDLQAQLMDLKVSSEAENKDNANEQKRQFNRSLLYGQSIQLLHVFSSKYLASNTTKTSNTELSNINVYLTEHSSKQSIFKIMPRFKVKSEGDLIQVEDQIILESVKSPGQFLHISGNPYNKQFIYPGSYELNQSVQQTGFTLYIRSVNDTLDIECFRGGDVIRIFHKEIEANLCCEGLFDVEQTEDVHFRFRAADQKKPRTLFPSTSAIIYWQILFADTTIQGGPIHWTDNILIKHMTTRKYLCIDSSNNIILVDKCEDKNAIFRLSPVTAEGDIVLKSTFCRIKHKETNSWLTALIEDYTRRDAVVSVGNSSMAILPWTSAKLRKIGLSVDMLYHDAYILEPVVDRDYNNFKYVAGSASILVKLSENKNEGMILKDKDAEKIIKILRDLQLFMIIDGSPCKLRQKLIRNLRVVEVLVKILQFPIRGSADQMYMTNIAVECYSTLKEYLKGNSRKNELYISKHIPFFETQVRTEGKIGFQVAQMVMELIKDNRQIVDRINRPQIDDVISLLKTKKDYRYLDILGVLCLCDGVSIRDNQNYIADKWLKDKTMNCVFLTDIGSKIGKGDNSVYVSTDNGKRFNSLSKFCQKKNLNVDLKYLFLVHQLDLFGYLCSGRNEYTINLITKDLNYLSWEEAYTCLTDKELPDELIAKYCNLIINLFVDVGNNITILESVNISLVYDNIPSSKKISAFTMSSNFQYPSDENGYISELQDWVHAFLRQNTDMTSSEIGHNILVSNVLNLVHYLVKYGFYNKPIDLEMLLTPLFGLLDGRNDKPYISLSDIPKNVLQNYRITKRFKKSRQTVAVVDAKCNAIKVIDLLINIMFNNRLESLISLFKEIHDSTFCSLTGSNILEPALYDTFDIEKNSTVARECIRQVSHIMQNSSLICATVDKNEFKETLLDLASYDYDEIVSKSLKLLNRYYSSHENLFKHVIQAQVLITERSVQVLSNILVILPFLKRIKKTQLVNENLADLLIKIDELIGYCYLDETFSETHLINQTMLFNQDILIDIFNIMSKNVDIKLMEKYENDANYFASTAYIYAYEHASNEQYFQLLGKFHANRILFEKCFELLKALAMNNHVVQNILFERLEFILNIKGAEKLMAETLIEVFTGNKDACMKVGSEQVHTIMSIISTLTINCPELLTVLNACVKVEELDLPLKRNQSLVIKYFMEFRQTIAKLIDVDNDKRIAILKGKDEQEKNYLIEMVDLLATCAEGENRFIESICQTIFSVDDLLNILVDTDIKNYKKLSFMRFLQWVYLNTADKVISLASGDFAHDERIWKLIKLLNDDVNHMNNFAMQNSERVKVLFKTKEKLTHEENVIKMTMIYLSVAAFTFINVFYQNFYVESDNESEILLTNEFGMNLTIFETKYRKYMQVLHIKNLIMSANSVLSSSKLDKQILNKFSQRTFDLDNLKDIITDIKRDYDDYYYNEEEVNKYLNTFSVNMSLAYGGLNDVETQIHYPSKELYTQIGTNEELPLGSEFQEHVQCFIRPNRSDLPHPYIETAKLVKLLEISIHFTFNDEKEKAEQEEVDVRTMKILRCLIHNEIVKLPEDYNINNKKIKKILKDIKSVQYALNEYGIVKFLSPHLSKNNSIIIREALALMVKILYMGNRQVQNSYVSYFLGSREENFFFAIKAFLENASIGIKERRSLINQHQQKISEAIADVIRFQSALQTNAKDKMESRKQFKRLESALKNGKLSLNSQKTNYRNPSAMIKNRLKSAKHGTKTSVVPETRAIPKFQLDSGNTGIKRFGLVTAKSKKKVSVNKIAPDDKMKSVNVAVDISTSNDVNRIINMAMENEEILNVANDDYGIELVLKILGLMCDGQNKILQGYLREQPDNIKSVNLIITTSQFMTMLYSSINSYTIIITINLVNTLIEFTSGNYQNQICVFDSKICDHINYILRAEIGNDIDEDKSIELMDSIATLIVSMVENHRSHAYTRDKNKCCVDVLECLDLMALVKIAVKFYENTVPFNTKKDYPESIATSALNAGFKYFYILTRIKELIQLGVIPMKEDFAPCPKIMAALQYYNSKTLSIEILMDGELERVYFKCNDKKVLREDIVSKFKYEVDRTSPTSKLRDLLVWSVDIMDDINYTKRIQRIPIVKLYLQYDYHLNIFMMLISFLYSILILVVWNQPYINGKPNYNSFKPTYNYFPIEFGWTFTILAILHNLSTCLVFVGYMILNHPTIRIPSFLRRGSVSKIERVSHLSVRLLGFQTLWHTLLLIMSAMGSIYYGYFFSFHLLHVAQFNQLIKRAIQAVTKNGDSLLWVTLYGVVFLYIYALITFAVYRELKKDEDKMFCNTMYECMLTMMHSGPIGDGVFDFLKSPTILPFNQKFNKAIFDIVFFIIITTIGLNIIFGIIVDTFSELRDNKWHVDNDMKTACFICSRPSYDFEQHSTGFKNHVDNEHNQWSYVFFFIYLNETFENDYTAIELYVHNMIINDSLEFFPLGKSLCFQSEEIAQDQNQIESLKDEIANLTQQLKSMQLIHTK